MAYIDELGRENVVFVPNVNRKSIMGEWDEQEIPILLLSTQSKNLWTGAAIEWRPVAEQETRVLAAHAAQERLRPIVLTVSDLLEWANISRDKDLPVQLVRVAINILSWLGRAPMNPQQHSQWSRAIAD